MRHEVIPRILIAAYFPPCHSLPVPFLRCARLETVDIQSTSTSSSTSIPFFSGRIPSISIACNITIHIASNNTRTRPRHFHLACSASRSRSCDVATGSDFFGYHLQVQAPTARIIVVKDVPTASPATTTDSRLLRESPTIHGILNSVLRILIRV